MEVKPWPPRRWTPPLSEGAPSLFERFRDVLRLAWEAARGYRLEPWQEQLLAAITELFPEGHPRAGQLRFRQVLVSLARQNGKSEIAAALGLLFMLARPTAQIVGIASTAEQARLVYDRASQVIAANPALARRFVKNTETRGLKSKTGAGWAIRAARSSVLQGIPVDLAVVDEVHLVKPELWADLVNGTGGRPDTLVIGITTAGDQDSKLLQGLYDRAEAAITDPGTRLGVFIWEADEALLPDDRRELPDDDAVLLTALAQANPALASGRLDPETVISDVRTLLPADAYRYRLNLFTTASAEVFTAAQWAPMETTEPLAWSRPTIAVDRTPDRVWTTIVAAEKVGASYNTQVVASLKSANTNEIFRAISVLMRHNPAAIVMDAYSLKELHSQLKASHYPVFALSQAEIVSASVGLYHHLKAQDVRHPGDPLLYRQLPAARRKQVGESWRISRVDATQSIDAVLATAFALYGAEYFREKLVPQLY